MSYFAGITDEAGEAIDTQIRVTRDLGWKHLELRKVSVDGGPAAMIHDISEVDFEKVAERIAKAGLRVSCFSSAIANWGKCVTESFEPSLAEARRCIPRMQAMGTRYVRIMSFKLLRDAAGRPLPMDRQLFAERVRRLRELRALFADAGLVAVHENCMNYGGLGWLQTLQLIDAVPGLKLVFDTGNPVFADDHSKSDVGVVGKQDAWEFYRNVIEHIAYVHVKDGVWNPRRNAADFCFPGEGEGRVRAILRDLKAKAFDGCISIEPHMAGVFHEPGMESDGATAKYQTFVEYGRRLEALWASV